VKIYFRHEGFLLDSLRRRRIIGLVRSTMNIQQTTERRESMARLTLPVPLSSLARAVDLSEWNW
jgi:hypothetical protein